VGLLSAGSTWQSEDMNELEMDRVMNLSCSYQEPRVLLTAVELGIFSTLQSAPLTPGAIAEKFNWDASALQVLLDALTVMGFLEKTLGRYVVANCNRRLLSPEDSRGVISTVSYAASLWNSWSNLTRRIVAGGQVPQIDSVKAFVATMHTADEKLAPGIVALIRPEVGTRFLDVGGGSGAYTIAFMARSMSLHATLLDHPEILEHTRGYLRAAGCAEFVELLPGDAESVQWPPNQGLIFLSALIHGLSVDRCEGIFRKAFESLEPGGRIALRDHIMSENRLRPRAGVLFNVNMLVSTCEGRTYTYSEIRKGLERAGFMDVRLLQDGERMNGVVEAFKPRSG
jgi:hypothetical protein